jgi:hypothetical protein
MGILDALSHDEPLAREIYGDVCGHSAFGRDHHNLDERAWKAIGDAFRQGRYVLAPLGDRGHVYTLNMNEVAAETTKARPAELISALEAAWPVIQKKGAWTMTAQYMHETNEGKNCYNWNLGNVKSPRTDVPHMYLRNNVEYEHGVAVVRQPPHPSCRFRAYPNLLEGVQHWIVYFQRLATHRADLLPALTAADLPKYAHILHDAVYYTGLEDKYRGGLEAKWRELVKLFGKAP